MSDKRTRFTKEDEILSDYNEVSDNCEHEEEKKEVRHCITPPEQPTFGRSRQRKIHTPRHHYLRTPSLPPNTHSSLSQVSSEFSSDLVIYPPPSTSAKYYDSLPEPIDLVLSLLQGKREQRDVREEFVNALRSKLVDIQSLPKVYSLEEILSSYQSKESLAEDSIEDIIFSKAKLKKSLSFKYDKTPPDQTEQSKKKIVKFADVFGMDLIEVRSFMACSTIIERSSITDLHLKLPVNERPRRLTPLFPDPILRHDFKERLNQQKICLEKICIGKDLSINGIISVVNLTCEKQVTVRHSFDNWKIYHEVRASYSCGSPDGNTDQFSFILWGEFLKDDGILDFCICYKTSGQEYWDNNVGRNYKLKCSAMPSYIPGQGSSRGRELAKSLQQLPQIDHLQTQYDHHRDLSSDCPWAHKFM